MYAIIETGGKQYRVETGALVQVESLPGVVGGTIELGQVRLVHGDKGIEVGQPLVKGATVKAEIIAPGPDPLHHHLQETTAQELSADQWPPPGLHQIAHYRYRNGLTRISHGNK